MNNKLDIEQILHNMRVKCIKLQLELENTKSLNSKTAHNIKKKSSLEHQLIDLKREFLEQEFQLRLDQYKES